MFAALFALAALWAALIPIHLPLVEDTAAQHVFFVHEAGGRSCGPAITAWRKADTPALLVVENLANGHSQQTQVSVSSCHAAARRHLLLSALGLLAALALLLFARLTRRRAGPTSTPEASAPLASVSP